MADVDWQRLTDQDSGATAGERFLFDSVGRCVARLGNQYAEGEIARQLVPLERRATLMASQMPDDAELWTFVVRLQGENETVFFDL